MFECDQCGACCRHLDRSEIYDYLNRGDGTCIYLDGNLCSIYDRRPTICRVDDSYNRFFKETMSLENYYKANYESCAILKKEE